MKLRHTFQDSIFHCKSQDSFFAAHAAGNVFILLRKFVIFAATTGR